MGWSYRPSSLGHPGPYMNTKFTCEKNISINKAGTYLPSSLGHPGLYINTKLTYEKIYL